MNQFYTPDLGKHLEYFLNHQVILQKEEVLHFANVYLSV